MFRRNPDAIAIVVFGFFMLALNAPRILIRDAHWEVTPLKMEIQAEREQLKAVKEQLNAHRDEIKAAAEEIRAAIRH
jgi:predicted  nucleic acid-binding Zn-ribbon protein